MLAIRFNRIGKKNQAAFRIVLQEKTKAPAGSTWKCSAATSRT